MKISVFILLLVFFASLLFFPTDLPSGDDLPMQLKDGELIMSGEFSPITRNFYSYTEPDHPFPNHHWLSSVVFYILHSAFGFGGMTIFKTVIFLLMFSILFSVALKKADFWLVAFFSLPTMIIFTMRSAWRPEMFSYLFIAIFLWFLTDLDKHPERKRIFWLVPLQLIWINLQLFAVIGVMLVAGFLFEKIALEFKTPTGKLLIKKLALLLAALVLVIFISPFGLQDSLSGFSFRLKATENSPVATSETMSLMNTLRFDPLFMRTPAIAFMASVALLFFSFLMGFWSKSHQPAISRGKPVFYLAASASTALLGFYAIRAMPLFGMIFLPAIASNLDWVYKRAREWLSGRAPDIKRALEYIIPICFIIFLLYLIFRHYPGYHNTFGIGLTPQSESSARFFKEQKLKGPIFNDTDIGGYLIYYLFPEERVFSDNRFTDAYSTYFWREVYLPMIQSEDKWQEGLKKYNFNAIFINHYDQIYGMKSFLWRRRYDPEWAWIYGDRYAVIFVRNNKENLEVINRFRITPDNIWERLSHLLRSNNPYELLAGADILHLAGMQDQAMIIYLKFLSQYPDNAKVWLVMGALELSKNDVSSNPALALIFIQRAVELGWKTADAYSLLASAYFRLGDLEKAEEAVKQELKIDPESEDGKGWMRTLAEEKAKRVK